MTVIVLLSGVLLLHAERNTMARNKKAFNVIAMFFQTYNKNENKLSLKENGVKI